MNSMIITKPDDWHVHFRDGQLLSHTVAATARHFSRALVMPNLLPPLTNLPALLAYRQRILAAVPAGVDFTPLMTLYLNETLTPETLSAAKQQAFIMGAKLYPAGATTHSAEGAQSIKALYPLLEHMQSLDLVLQIHGERNQGDIFHREARFVHEDLQALVQNFPRLRIVLEHISSQEAVAFVEQAPANVAATISVHHLLYNRNQLLAGGLRPHYYCLPILKSERHQRAVQAAALSTNRKFFAGTDSAPHAQAAKESACGCAGLYTAPYALALYGQFFDQHSALPALEAFVSHFGADFYQQPRNASRIALLRKAQTVPSSLPLGDTQVIPIEAGNSLEWCIDENP
ncbi:MAG: dihydroorotase [Legionellaceae bacterium]|nr:dihydroorotase [Legionellaceae bacterium]